MEDILRLQKSQPQQGHHTPLFHSSVYKPESESSSHRNVTAAQCLQPSDPRTLKLKSVNPTWPHPLQIYIVHISDKIVVIGLALAQSLP